MNCKKYRACLIGVIAFAIVLGFFACVKYEKENRIPTGGVLVKENVENREEAWA